MFPVNAFAEGFIRGLFFTEKGLFTVYVSGSDFAEGLLSSFFLFCAGFLSFCNLLFTKICFLFLC